MKALYNTNFDQEKITKPDFQSEDVFSILKIVSENSKVAHDELVSPIYNTSENSAKIKVLENWFLCTEDLIFQSQSSSILEFTVLALLFKSNYYLQLQIPELHSRLVETLKSSRALLTNEIATASNLTKRLPKSILAVATRDEVLFHQSIYHLDGNSKNKDGLLNLKQTLQLIGLNYIPRLRDFTSIAGLFTLMYFSSTFAELVVGLFVGYCFSSVVEYYVHQNIGHASPKVKSVFRKMGKIGRDMLSFSLEHSVHHASVHNNYVNPFAPKSLATGADYIAQTANREKVDSVIFRRNGEHVLKMIVNSDYGLKSSNQWRTHLFFFPISLLVLMLMELAFSSHTSLVFSFGFLFLSAFWISASSIYHPCLHFSEDKIDKDVNFLLRWFLKTRLSRFIAHSHRMHHVHGGHVNQNLNIGFDYIFEWSPITTTELLELKSIKSIY